MINLLPGFYCGLFIHNTGCHGYTPVAIVTSLHAYTTVTMFSGLHAAWVSNTIVLKTGRSARVYGVSQLFCGPLYGNERLDYM